jgi:hypothetical protein
MTDKKKSKLAKKESWSCMLCGATTTDPTQALITYFHWPCPKR